MVKKIEQYGVYRSIWDERPYYCVRTPPNVNVWPIITFIGSIFLFGAIGNYFIPVDQRKDDIRPKNSATLYQTYQSKTKDPNSVIKTTLIYDLDGDLQVDEVFEVEKQVDGYLPIRTGDIEPSAHYIRPGLTEKLLHNKLPYKTMNPQQQIEYNNLLNK